MNVPIRLGPAELALVEQLRSVGADAEAERLAVAGLPTRRCGSTRRRGASRPITIPT